MHHSLLLLADATPAPAQSKPPTWPEFPPGHAPWEVPGHTIIGLAPFLFVLFIILIFGYFRMRRQQLWHETARLALEKGQPLPPFFNRGACGGRRRFLWLRGLIWMAAGVGIHYSRISLSKWAPIPFCIGLAMVIGGAIVHFITAKDKEEPAQPS